MSKNGIEIARRRNGRVDRPGLDDDNATSLKHGNEAFLDYMLDSVFVGSKWINWLVEPVIAYAHSPPQSEKSEKSNIISIFEGLKKRKKGPQKKGGGGWKFTHFTSPGSAPAHNKRLKLTKCWKPCLIRSSEGNQGNRPREGRSKAQNI